MTTVLFIIQDDKLPSSRVRVLNLLPEIKKHGISADVVQYPKGTYEKLRLFKRCSQYDITYLQKKLLSPIDTSILRKYARRLLFDFDDAIYYRQYEDKGTNSWTRYFKFKYLVQKADIVIAGNRILSDFAARFNHNVVVIPSAVETRNIPLNNHDNQTGNVIIGWVGGSVNLPYLELISDTVLPGLSNEYKIELRILSNKSINIPSVNVNFIPWKLDTQEKEIAEFDIGVMPLPHNKYTEGKCGYKALQYMAASVPPVCSDVGINRDIIENGRDGFVVKSSDEFYQSLKTLLDSRELRKEMGINARRKVIECFSISVVGKLLSDTIA